MRHAKEDEMSVLGVGSKVRIEGENTVYVVVRVDRERYVADLLPVAGKPRIESNVPLTSIRPASDRPLQTDRLK